MVLKCNAIYLADLRVLMDVDDPLEATCKGCQKLVANSSLLRHVGMSQTCKAAYGDTYFKMLAGSRQKTLAKAESRRSPL